MGLERFRIVDFPFSACEFIYEVLLMLLLRLLEMLLLLLPRVNPLVVLLQLLLLLPLPLEVKLQLLLVEVVMRLCQPYYYAHYLAYFSFCVQLAAYSNGGQS